MDVTIAEGMRRALHEVISGLSEEAAIQLGFGPRAHEGNRLEFGARQRSRRPQSTAR